MWRWLFIGILVLIACWIFRDIWSLMRVEIRDAFWWMFP
jgi:hypothetical protein